MYNRKVGKGTMVKSEGLVEGETIEMKVERMVSNKEPIKDGAPEIFTERKEGVISAYNIRTDRWEIATDAMDAVSKSKLANREARMNPKEEVVEKDVKEVKVVKLGNEGDSGAESTQGKSE